MLQIRGGRELHADVCSVIADFRSAIRYLGGILIVLNSVGCDALQKKHENPVLMDVPRRVSRLKDKDDVQVAEAPKGGVTPAGATNEPGKFKIDPWADWEDDTAIYNSKVAATVNGAPSLNGDVLDRYSAYLIGMREKIRKDKGTPDDYTKIREMFVQRDLQGHIQRRLLVESMRTSLKPDQIKAMNAHLDGLFEREVEKLKRELKVSTRTELELELNKKGTTLQNVKDGFTTERMAMEFVAMKMDKAEHIDRLDLLDYYQKHLDDYAIAAKVDWEQIQVSFGDKASKEKAREKLTLALKELRSGAPFGSVASKYSDGPTAKEGGVWEGMEAGSLVDQKLEKLLFQMPVGEMSGIYEGPSALQVVRVRARHEAGRTPFGDVQDDIRKKLEDEQNKKRPDKLFKKLMSEAVIETKYDMQNEEEGEKP